MIRTPQAQESERCLCTDVMEVCAPVCAPDFPAGTDEGGISEVGMSTGYRPSASRVCRALLTRSGLNMCFWMYQRQEADEHNLTLLQKLIKTVLLALEGLWLCWTLFVVMWVWRRVVGFVYRNFRGAFSYPDNKSLPNSSTVLPHRTKSDLGRWQSWINEGGGLVLTYPSGWGQAIMRCVWCCREFPEADSGIILKTWCGHFVSHLVILKGPCARKRKCTGCCESRLTLEATCYLNFIDCLICSKRLPSALTHWRHFMGDACGINMKLM